MSIIHDALKKVQINFQRKPAPETSFHQAIEQNPKKFNFFNASMTLIVLAVCAYFAYSYLPKHWDNIPKISITTSTPADQKIKTLSAKRTPVAIAKISPDSDSQDGLNLQGILTQNGQTVALINDKIYEEGDEIGRIKILNIEGSGITVLNNGNKEHVRVRP